MIPANSAPTETPESLVFSSFYLDLRGGRLVRGRDVVPLRPKTWAVLLYLAQRPGVLVTREELLNAVWPGVAVTADTLTKSIGELRLALADDSKTPRCIETVHRRGFRFIARADNGAAPAPSVWEWSDAVLQPRPFVGRETELRELHERWARAQAGERQIVFVTGPAGIGKTALVDAFLDSAAVRERAPVWIGRGGCVEHHGPREAYMPVLEALERLVRGPEAERIVRRLRRAAPTWVMQMPWLIGDDAEASQYSLYATSRERMLRELAAVIEPLTAEIPLVLVLEDLHWSDPSTVDLLSFLAQRREPARLLVLGTYRPAEVALQEHVLRLAMRTLQARRQVVTVPVYDLSVEDVCSYLAQRFPGAELPGALAQMIYAHTDGNPLFVVSVVDLMLSRGWILETGPGWALSAPPEQIDLGVPDDVRRMIEVQVRGLSPAERDLLEVASVCGVELDPPALSDALGCDAAEIERRCEMLARANRFLRAAGSSELPDGSMTRRYGFTHELYRQALYAEIPDGRRRRLHQSIGESLEAAYGSRTPDIVPRLALHFEKSRDYGRAVRYLSAAAIRARQRLANAEALAYLESALALAERLPNESERLRCELQLRIALGPVLNDLHGYASDGVRKTYERVDVVSAQIGTPTEQFEAVYALCHFHAVRGNAVEVEAAAARLDALAGETGAREDRLLADSALVRIAVVGGRFAQGCAQMESRLLFSGSTAVAVRPDFGPDPVIDATSHYALALWFLGYPERARTIARANLEAARASGIQFTLAAALFHTGVLELFCGDAGAALALAEEAALLSAERGLIYWSAMAAAARGAAWNLRGDAREAITELEGAGAALEATGARLFVTHVLAFLADAHLRAGAPDAGLAAIEKSLSLAETTFDRSYRPELWRLKGVLLQALHAGAPIRTRRGRPVAGPGGSNTEAERCFERALDGARASQAKSLELRAATSLARSWQAGGRAAEARKLLGGVVKFFGAADSPDLAQARVLLQQLRAPA